MKKKYSNDTPIILTDSPVTTPLLEKSRPETKLFHGSCLFIYFPHPPTNFNPVLKFNISLSTASCWLCTEWSYCYDPTV